MTTQFKLETDTRAPDKLLARIALVTPKKMSELVRQEAALTAKQIAQVLPPQSVGQGKRRVAKDINLLFIPTSKIYKEMKAINPDMANAFWKLVKARNFSEAHELMKSLIPRYSKIEFADVPTPELHRNTRSQKTGQINPRQYPREAVSEAKALTRFITERQDRVGTLKSPWATVAAKLGQRLPAWITKHKTPYLLEDNTSNRLDPSVKIGSALSYGSQPRFRRSIEEALKSRRNALERRLNDELKKIFRK